MLTRPASVLDHLLAPETIANPHSFYGELREQHPVYWNAQFQLWVVTRYDDVSTLLQDPRLHWSQGNPDMQDTGPADLAGRHYLESFRANTIIAKDGAEHTRLRRLIHAAFTPRIVEQMRATIQRETDRLIDAVLTKGSFEVLADLAAVLPRQTIFALCGVPDHAWRQIVRGADALVFSLSEQRPPPGRFAAWADDLRVGEAYLREFIAGRRAAPQDDLLGALLLAEENGSLLNEQELVNFVYALLLAGFETTAHLIANGLLTLLRHPEQLECLRSDPALIGSAVQELLRFEPAVMNVMRLTREPLSLHGQTIPPGQVVLLSLATANRDPRQFPAPERLDITREPNRHLSFGYGPHYCIGAALARLECQIAIGSVLERMPGLRLTGEPLRWLPNFLVRGLHSLPLLIG